MKFQMKKQITIQAPATKVWRIVAHEFDQISKWSSDIPASKATDNGSGPDAAPVCGRVCTSPGFGDVEEVFTYYDEESMCYGYRGTQMPSFIKNAENNWRVQALSPHTAMAEFVGKVELNPLLALFVIPYFSIIGPRVLKELKYYAEHDRPHPRKQKALQRQVEAAH